MPGTVWGMFAGRRVAIIGMAGAVIWYACIVVFWALPSMNDSVPVGIDYALASPAFVSISVKCNGPLDSAPKDNSPLPTLKVQPKGKPPLGYQREPCALVHQQARIVFALDTLSFAAVVGCFGWLMLRRRKAVALSQPRRDSGLAESMAR